MGRDIGSSSLALMMGRKWGGPGDGEHRAEAISSNSLRATPRATSRASRPPSYGSTCCACKALTYCTPPLVIKAALGYAGMPIRAAPVLGPPP
jgi:hypothetical protein